jgi:hypothetical protein
MRDLKKDVLFVASYEDGLEETFGIGPDDLTAGRESPMDIARRLQRAAWLPKGIIREVIRKKLTGAPGS